MNYMIYGKTQRAQRKKLRLKPQIKIGFYKLLTGSIIALYLAGIILGIDYKNAVDIAVGADIAMFGLFNGIEIERK